MKLDSIAKRFRIDKPKHFRIADHDPAECCGLTVDKAEAKVLLDEGIERLPELQQRLYASNTWSVCHKRTHAGIAMMTADHIPWRKVRRTSRTTR